MRYDHDDPLRGRGRRRAGLRAHHPDHGAGPFEGGPFARPHHGPQHGPHPGRRGGRGRAPRGDVRTAVLLLLTEEPMHGYQLMQAIAERSGGQWTPSPGAIYPTISQLEDEGLVTVTPDAGRKLVTLTDAGQQQAEARRAEGNDPFAGRTENPTTDLRGLVAELHGAVRQVARTGTDAQLAAAAQILTDARRALYLLLADGPAAGPGA